MTQFPNGLAYISMISAQRCNIKRYDDESEVPSAVVAKSIHCIPIGTFPKINNIHLILEYFVFYFK